MYAGSQYAGLYTYGGMFNEKPYFKQDNGDWYIYRNTMEQGNENWHFLRTLGSPYADLYASKSDCPADAAVWNALVDGQWTAIEMTIASCPAGLLQLTIQRL